MRIIETKVYTIEEHPNKEVCFKWIRDNWHDLNEHSVYEVVDSIKKLSDIIGGTYDYSIGQNPDRGEHITFKGYNQEKLCRLSSEDCSLTGVFWDMDLIRGLREGDTTIVLKSLHKNTEFVYSNEGLLELCMANGYEFNEDGEFLT